MLYFQRIHYVKYQYFNKNKVPKGGWFYVIDDDIHTQIEASNEPTLLLDVINYYDLNDIPRPDKLRERIKEQVCQRVGPKYCKATSEGFGDTLAKAFEATGVAKIAKKIARNKGKSNCSACDKRQRALNKKFPYQR